MFLICHIPGRSKPLLKRNTATVENRTRCNRHLAPAFRTGPAPIGYPPALGTLAFRAPKSGGPTQLLQVRNTGLLVDKPGEKLLPRSRIWGNKLPEMTDQQPLPVESTVLRQLPN